jgi:hypothetical protein
MERTKKVSNEKNGKNVNEKTKAKSMKKYLITLCMKFQTCFTPEKKIFSGMLPNEYNEGYLYPIMSCFWRREGWGATRSILYI